MVARPFRNLIAESCENPCCQHLVSLGVAAVEPPEIAWEKYSDYRQTWTKSIESGGSGLKLSTGKARRIRRRKLSGLWGEDASERALDTLGITPRGHPRAERA